MSKNIEIELKLPLLNGKQVEAFLTKQATFKYKSFQHDVPPLNYLTQHK